MAPSLLQRLMRPASTAIVRTDAPEPKRLLTPASMVQTIEKKASSYARLPTGAYGQNYTFFSPDGGRTMIDFADGPVVVALVAYWYVATRWRAEKFAEAPLMVVAEDQDSGDEEWLPDHELTPLLEEPSLDYDMGELLMQTSHYLDNTGSALWVKDYTGINGVGRLTAFCRHEFEIQRAKDRIFGTFIVQTYEGPKSYAPTDVCFFKDSQLNSRGWIVGKSRLDVALSWLQLGERSRRTIYSLLGNSVWPSIVVSPDASWDPDEEVFKQYVQELEKYGKADNKGAPFVALGGAKVTQLAAQIKDLVPNDILNRVESVVAAITGVPAIVLQYQVGMENSPWSQMAEARKMAYDDTIAPMWRKTERVLTRQLLRDVDEDPTHYIRFDTTNVESLKRDQLETATVATTIGRMATLNERRQLMGLEPASKKQDPNGKADEIPELNMPSALELAVLAGGGNPADPKQPDKPKPKLGDTSEEDPAAVDPTAVADPSAKTPPKSKKPKGKNPFPPKKFSVEWYERKFKVSALLVAMRDEAIPLWQVKVAGLLHEDADAIASIVKAYITNGGEKSLETKARQKDRAMSAVSRYLNEESKSRWSKTLGPLSTQAAQRGTAVVTGDLNISFNLVNSNLLSFAKSTAAKTITDISGTSRDLVSGIIQGGLDANATNAQIAQLIRDATGFSKSRSRLIARTETTKIFNGAPERSLSALSKSTGVRYTKTWSGVLDDVERDEHVELEGETVDVGDVFSNGLDYPSEPNCRCTCLFAQADE